MKTIALSAALLWHSAYPTEKMSEYEMHEMTKDTYDSDMTAMAEMCAPLKGTDCRANPDCYYVKGSGCFYASDYCIDVTSKNTCIKENAEYCTWDKEASICRRRARAWYQSLSDDREVYYTELRRPKTWAEAKKQCASLGPGVSLAHIVSLAENNFIKNTFSGERWTAGTNAHTGNSFEWCLNPGYLSYSAFMNWQFAPHPATAMPVPNPDTQCMKMDTDSGLWDVENCDRRLPAICERHECEDDEDKPEPTPCNDGYLPTDAEEWGQVTNSNGDLVFLRYLNYPASFHEAVTLCRALDPRANLASVSDSVENAYIESLTHGHIAWLAGTDWPIPGASYSGPGFFNWVFQGLVGLESVAFTAGTGYQNFFALPSYTIPSPAHYVVMNKDSPGQWSSVEDCDNYGYVCKIACDGDPCDVLADDVEAYHSGPADNCNVTAIRGDLCIAVDVTGSMGAEINAIKVGLNNVAGMGIIGSGPSASYSKGGVVLYAEPSACLTTYTDDMVNYVADVNTVNIQKPCGASGPNENGGDCPEYAFTGIETCLNTINPYSVIYVITDADAKDNAMYAAVSAQAQAQNTRINFILTRTCSGSGSPFHPGVEPSYEMISTDTGGQIYHIEKSHIATEIVDIVESSASAITCPNVISSTTYPAGTHTFTIPGYNHMTSMQFTVAGSTPAITCVNQMTGLPIPTAEMNVIMDLMTNYVLEVPRIGASSAMLWYDSLTCTASATSDFTVTINSCFVGCEMGDICLPGYACQDHDDCCLFTCEPACDLCLNGPVPTNPDDWTLVYNGDREGVYYQFFDDKKTWEKAQQMCREADPNAHLARIEDAIENTHVSMLTGGVASWLGGKVAPSGSGYSFSWIDHDMSVAIPVNSAIPPGYENWDTADPDSFSSGSYVVINDLTPGKWYDFPMGEHAKYAFVCEIRCNTDDTDPIPTETYTYTFTETSVTHTWTTTEEPDDCDEKDVQNFLDGTGLIWTKVAGSDRDVWFAESKEHMSWDQQQDYCNEVTGGKGTLARIMNSAENNFIKNSWIRPHWTAGKTPTGSFGDFQYLQKYTSPAAVWNTTPYSTFLAWVAPADGNCMYVDANDGTWHVDICDRAHPAVCEYECDDGIDPTPTEPTDDCDVEAMQKMMDATGYEWHYVGSPDRDVWFLEHETHRSWEQQQYLCNEITGGEGTLAKVLNDDEHEFISTMKSTGVWGKESEHWISGKTPSGEFTEFQFLQHYMVPSNFWNTHPLLAAFWEVIPPVGKGQCIMRSATNTWLRKNCDRRAACICEWECERPDVDPTEPTTGDTTPETTTPRTTTRTETRTETTRDTTTREETATVDGGGGIDVGGGSVGGDTAIGDKQKERSQQIKAARKH